MGMFGSSPPPGCPPAPPPPPAVAPFAPGNYDPCIMCSMARQALFALMGGSKAQRVAFGSHGRHREVTYSAGNVKELRAEVRRLEQECELSRGGGRARGFGPSIPNGAFGLRQLWPFSNPFDPSRYR